MIFALIPAAGQSTRMGRPKLLLPLGGRPVLEHVIRAIQMAGIDRILVVAAPHLPELVPLAKEAGARAVPLYAATSGMRATVEFGLRWAEANWQPTADDAFLLVPGDHPTLDPTVIRQLLDARKRLPQFSVFCPTYEGRRGHPTLIGWEHVAGIRDFPAEQGLNLYLRQQTIETHALPVDSSSVLGDLDTPEEYERLLKTWPA